MTNVSEHLIKIVIQNKPKMLTGLNQKVCGQVWRLIVSSNMGVAPPVDRMSLNWNKSVKRNMVSPMLSPNGVKSSQERLMEQWVKEDRESECSPVIGEIKVEPKATLLYTKVSRLLSGSCLRENLLNPQRLESR